MINFNAESMKQVETSTLGLFTDLKGMFIALGKIVNGCGDNPAAAKLGEMGFEAEKSVNDNVLPAFMNLRAGIATYCSNLEEWEATCGRMESVNFSGVMNVEVENKVQAVTFK